MKMKAISLWQPHASLIGRGKLYETRSWATPYQGALAIHAAKNIGNMDLCDLEPWGSSLFMGPLALEDLPLGAVVAVCRLTGCIRTGLWCSDIPEPARTFGDFSPGRYAWKLEDVLILPEPIPMRGQQGMWDVDITAPASTAPAKEGEGGQ